MKWFTREFKIGLTGIIALVVLFLGINFLKGVQIFNVSDYYYITFTNAKGLTKSSPVYADGFDIGIVSDVTYDYNHPGQVVVEISVNGDVKIPHGTLARLDEGMLGGCTLNMIMGANPANCYLPGDTIVGDDNKGLMGSVEQVMPKVEDVLAHVDSLIVTLNKLANSPQLPQIMANAEEITANLNESSKQLNTILNKDVPQLTATLNRVGDNAEMMTANMASLDLQGTIDKVNSAMENVEQTTQKLQDTDNNIGLMLNDSSLYNNLNTSVNSATLLLRDLQKNPKRYVHFSVFGSKTK